MTVYSKQPTFEDYSPEYQAFVKKFETKKTTDDCYTPPEVYQCVLDWAVERYGFTPEQVVRPFYPGGDFEYYDYPEDCVVLDNPPFSILSKILAFYRSNDIRFFLFFPANVLRADKACTIAAQANIIYENGANVLTNFVTSFEPGVALMAAPTLHDRLEEVCKKLAKKQKKQVAKLAFPDDVITAARAGWMSSHGTDYAVRWDECTPIKNIGATQIYGGGLLLSSRAAAERAAAERAAAERAAAERAAAERAAAERAVDERAVAERAAALKLELTPSLKALQAELDAREA